MSSDEISPVDRDAVVLPYSPRPTPTTPDTFETTSEDLVRVAWTVQRHEPTGEWALHLYEIGADGTEEPLTEMPLDPDTAGEMSTALATAYQDMTGTDLPTADFAGAQHQGGRFSRDQVRTGVLIALLAVILVAFVVNLFS